MWQGARRTATAVITSFAVAADSTVAGVGMSHARPDYGIDAPGLVRTFFIIGVGAALLAIGSSVELGDWYPWNIMITLLLALVAGYALGMGAFMVSFSKVTKVREREALLDLWHWQGDEHVLDVGCGRGLMLVGAARRLRTGRATGIDLWQASDQSANSAQGALDNAAIEGVADRVEVHTADMRSLPFGDNCFDVVVSHWAVHNVEPRVERTKALAEMIRVTKPSGAIILTDIINRQEYSTTFEALGVSDRRLVVDRERDRILRTISFGSFQPATIVARMG